MQNGSTTDRGVLASCLRSDGRYRDKLYVDGGPSTTGTVGYVRMDGPEVFRHAVALLRSVRFGKVGRKFPKQYMNVFLAIM